MKKLTDTYCLLGGKTWQITEKTQLLCGDEAARAQLAGIRAHVSGRNALERIVFSAMDPKVTAHVLEAFGTEEAPVPDSYIIEIAGGEIRVYTDTPNGIRYAACAIVSHYEDGIPEGLLYNVPLAPFRAMKVYIPAEENIPFFKEFIEMCMYYGYNTLIMEVGGAMEYKKHPEINEGWEEYAALFREYPGKSDDVQRCMPWLKDSIHWENGGGSCLTQEQLRELIDFCNAHGMTVIPEVPCLSHSDYLLTRHPELAENQEDPLPDSYCPSDPRVYDLLFDVLDEVIEVFRPAMVHIAHDEWYSACLCGRCASRDPGELFAADVNKIQAYLKAKGIASMIWGDMLFTFEDRFGNIRGAGIQVRKLPQDRTVTIRGRAYHTNRELWGKAAHETNEGFLFQAPESGRAIDLICRDVKIMNWMHTHQPKTDAVYRAAGYETVYGNLIPRNFDGWFERIGKGVQGLSISNWSMLDQRHMQRNAVLFHMVYGAMMLWNRDFREEDYAANTLAAAKELYRYHYRDALRGARAEIVHAATVTIPHAQFVDGSCMNEEADRMGWYRIDYADGTQERIDIFWGLNIGIQRPWLPQKKELDYHEMDFLEPTYTCDYEIIEGQTWYRLLIPLKKPAVRIVPEFLETYRDAVKIHSLEIFQSDRRDTNDNAEI